MRDEIHGKRSLFGAPPAQPPEPASHDGPVRIDCARCGVSTRVGVTDVLRRLLPVIVWIPGRTYSRRMRCPACDRRSWVRLRLS